MSISTKVIIPEITDIVNFYKPDLVEKIARELITNLHLTLKNLFFLLIGI